MEEKTRKSPLSNLLEKAEKLTGGEITELDKRYHQMSILQLEAMDKLITTIKNLDNQNKKLEESNLNLQKSMYNLSFIAIFFTVFQFFFAIFGNSIAFTSLFVLGLLLLLGALKVISSSFEQIGQTRERIIELPPRFSKIILISCWIYLILVIVLSFVFPFLPSFLLPIVNFILTPFHRQIVISPK